jgi:hypothetical protein
LEGDFCCCEDIVIFFCSSVAESSTNFGDKFESSLALRQFGVYAYVTPT